MRLPRLVPVLSITLALAACADSIPGPGTMTVTLEGPEETSRVVVIEFDSLERVKSFYESDEYQAAIGLRTAASTGQLIAVAGV